MKWSLLVFGVWLVSCQQKIAEDLSSQSANQSLLFLERVGVSASIESEQDTFSLWVSRAEASTARQLLQENFLPARQPDCKPSGLFPSPQEESDAKRACLAYQMAERIASLPGVLSANVVLPVSSASPWPITESPIEHVTVLYSFESRAIPEEQVKELIFSSLNQKPKISIVSRPLSVKPAQWVSVGPFAVAPSSERSLFFSLLSLISFGIGSVFVCLSLWLRQRRFGSKS